MIVEKDIELWNNLPLFLIGEVKSRNQKTGGKEGAGLSLWEMKAPGAH